jgi:Arc/MetJ-type ribon-helix-helix transcriptional regulator
MYCELFKDAVYDFTARMKSIRSRIMKTVQTEVPEALYNKAMALVNEGWFRDEKDVFSEAIRRFLDTHQSELMQKFIRDDIEWGLRGND